MLTKTKPRKRRLVSIKKRPRINRGASRGRSTTAQKHRLQAKEPWILATNLTLAPPKIVSIYAQRMQIEQIGRQLTNCGEVFGSVVLANAAVVCAKHNIEDPMQVVFHGPMRTNRTAKVLVAISLQARNEVPRIHGRLATAVA